MSKRATKPTRTDPFKVWGQPPAPLDKLPKKHLAALRRYIESVTGKAYRLAYDNGVVEGYTTVSMLAAVKLREQRDRMLKSAR